MGAVHSKRAKDTERFDEGTSPRRRAINNPLVRGRRNCEQSTHHESFRRPQGP